MESDSIVVLTKYNNLSRPYAHRIELIDPDGIVYADREYFLFAQKSFYKIYKLKTIGAAATAAAASNPSKPLKHGIWKVNLIASLMPLPLNYHNNNIDAKSKRRNEKEEIVFSDTFLVVSSTKHLQQQQHQNESLLMKSLERDQKNVMQYFERHSICSSIPLTNLNTICQHASKWSSLYPDPKSDLI